MGFGPIEIAWMLFIAFGVPALGLWRIAMKRDQPRELILFGLLSYVGFVVGALIMLRRPKGPNVLPEDRDDNFGRFDLR